MDKIKAFIKANAGSWTVKLGVLSAIVVALIDMVPQVQALLGDSAPWLVVVAMYLGRAKGLLDKAKAAVETAQQIT